MLPETAREAAASQGPQQESGYRPSRECTEVLKGVWEQQCSWVPTDLQGVNGADLSIT